ncbi:phage tail protein [Methylomonas sp. MO1]|jgi:phage tail-like protein|uniref:Phage tail protein n=2 Tax=Methylomonas TaxID=416 RepID=A0A126T2D8_9GAMM|nr:MULTISPECIES: phage tail protein [Methylomonas]AMK76248.1 phage tail protein [Methylomonas denitrificans]MDT4290088.1 phage tail protein [Methylomonas sp. MO1]OAI00689.1 phage tail protein [Methylomonas methanica]OAI01639.1 phage tail protein [Methylomonas methanica]OAI08937.1 phage tail protein [Methylomonas methanica]
MATYRETPYGVFNYLVNLGDGSEGEVQGGFSEVSGLNAEVTVAEYRNGNEAVNYVRKIPAINKAGDVTLKRGVIGAENIYNWLEQIRGGDVTAKRDVVIKLKNEDPTSASAVVTWKLVRAMPIKWTGPTLTAKGGSDVAMEELVLSVETIIQS